jgi:hypothetical protein
LQLNNCLKILYLTDPQDDLKTVEYERGKIIEGTCEWILAQAEYIQWLNRSSLQVLKLIGSPGIGKTTIVRFLLQNIQSQIASTTGSILLYYFCDNRDENRQSPTTILRSLLRQLLKVRPQYFKRMQSEFEEIGDKLVQSVHTLWRHFKELLQEHDEGAIYVLVDALDETDRSLRKPFIQMLSELPYATGYLKRKDVKFLITSRPEQDVENLLGGIWPSIRVDSEKVNHDLSKYITERVHDLASKKHYSEELRKDVEAALTQQAMGTFLWVSFVLKDLAESRMYQVRMKLQNLPSGLDEIYQRILRQIKPEHLEAAIFVLRWMIVAQRPMRLIELAIAYGVRKQLWRHGTLPSKPQTEELMDIYKPCEPLLFVDLENEMINLIHPSIKDFLLSNQLQQSSELQQYFVQAREAHLMVFETCWAYFESEDFDNGGRIVGRSKSSLTSKQETWEFVDLLPPGEKLLPYAGAGWANHAQSAGNLILSKVEWNHHRLSKLPNIRDYWLHHSVQAGQKDIVRFLLNNGADCNITTRDFGRKTPLQEAVFNADEEIVKLLLDHGADVNMRNELGTTAIYTATFCKKVEVRTSIERLLVDWGAEPLETKSRICSGVSPPSSRILEDQDVFDSGNGPNELVVRDHFLQEGRLSEEVALKIVRQATNILRKEPNLLELLQPITICGAIFGQYFDLVKLFHVGGSLKDTHYLFLGNFESRGYFSVECVLYLYTLKLRYPEKLFMLRGNRECVYFAEYFEFKNECLHKYSLRLYEAFISSFNALPLAAIVNHRFFCSYGGISPELTSLKDVVEVRNLSTGETR